MDTTTFVIILLAGAAIFYLFGGRLRRSPVADADGTAGSNGGGCCGGGGGGGQQSGRRSKKDTADVDAWVDPVCGMAVEVEHAAAMKRYKGNVFYFCSEKCRAAFGRNPRKYVKKEELSRTPAQSGSGGGHGCCG